MPAGLTDRLLSLAQDLGAASAGVSPAAPFEPDLAALRANIASGRCGPLHFVYDDPETATTVTRSFPWAKSILVVGWNYLAQATAPGDEGGEIGRFATSNHYLRLNEITSGLADHLRRLGYRAETLIDDNRMVDRAAAVRAGVGWRGKSTMVLTPGHGPWMLLGSVVTDAPLDSSRPMRRGCGSCVACYPACPTGALSDRGLDARRCLSTWLQSKGSIPHWIRPRLGRRVYGCDDCLTSCPPGKRALEGADAKSEALRFSELLALEDESLAGRFHWWYVPMRDGRYLRRNLLIAAGNSAELDALPQIEAHLVHPSSMIRGVAAWALGRAQGSAAAGQLTLRLDVETTPETRDELSLALLMISNPDAYRDLVVIDEWVNTSEVALNLAVLERLRPPARNAKPGRAGSSRPALRHR